MISIIIPFHDERANLEPLYKELHDTLLKMGEAYEILFIDDGSTDNGQDLIKAIAHHDPNVQLLRHNKRLGKGEALRKGLLSARGDIVSFMDGDLQDDPADLPHFFAKMKDGADFVNGIRLKRKDNTLVRTYSVVVNSFLRMFLQSPFTDINCGYKMFRKDILNDFVMYGNNFRFLPLAAYYKGFRVEEIKVHNRPRVNGKTKYGVKKLFIGIFDTITASFLYRFSEQPLHFFGIIGGIFFLTGFFITLVLAIERLFFNVLLYRRPSLLLGILLIIVGIQIGMTGIIGELIVYQHKKSCKGRS